MMAKEGVESITSRHAVIGEFTRAEGQGSGPALLAEGPKASNTVTSVRVPEGVKAAALLAMLNNEYETVLAAGQGKLAGKIVRIGHMGLVDKSDIELPSSRSASRWSRLGYKKPAAVALGA